MSWRSGHGSVGRDRAIAIHPLPAMLLRPARRGRLGASGRRRSGVDTVTNVIACRGPALGRLFGPAHFLGTKLLDVQRFRRTKAQECRRFAAAAVDLDDRLFWSRLADQWLELADGSEKETRRRRFFGFISGD
jgi:hypothetical protein